MGAQAGGVTYSAAAIRSTLAGFNCTSVYTDYAPLSNLREIASAMGGGWIGGALNPKPQNGLPRGGTRDGMFQVPYGHSQPDVVDLHAYPCVDNGDGCKRSEPDAQTQSEGGPSCPLPGYRSLDVGAVTLQ